jgi:cyclophilin family peptidyl-prolyl cis-trans isomerase
MLSMANSGPHTNGSQFFLCFGTFPHLDNKHVVFGKISSGMEILGLIEAQGSSNGNTKQPVEIKNSG